MNRDPFARLRRLQSDTIAAGQRLDSMRGRFDRLRDRHTNGAAPQAVSAWQLFQTPPALARRLVGFIPPALLAGRVLEPSAGLGRLLDAVAEVATPAETVAVEMAAECARVLFEQNRPGVQLRQRDFLACTPDDLGTFDAVAMNPPFHLRADIAHIQHALKFLRPGGLLAALCLSGVARSATLQPMATHWETIPAGTFAKEGTRVETVLLTIRKA